MIVVFDGKCLLCNGSVQFLLRHDKRGVFQFASIQGAAGGALLAKAGLQVDGLETLLLVDGERSGNTRLQVCVSHTASAGRGGWRGCSGSFRRHCETRCTVSWRAIAIDGSAIAKPA